MTDFYKLIETSLDRHFADRKKLKLASNGFDCMNLQEPKHVDVDFWDDRANQYITWDKPFDKVLDNSNAPFTKWFTGGRLNVCYNCIDRHVLAGNGDRTAVIYDSAYNEEEPVIKYSYAQTLDQVARFATVLSRCGVRIGDTVLIYMPMVPQTIFAMLACARLGAVHSLVFGGFGSKELAVRISHCQPKVILSANYGIEPGRMVDYKELLDAAIDSSTHTPKFNIIYQRPHMVPAPLKPGFDLNWEEEMLTANPHAPVQVESSHPLYILYTSGTTGDPKAVVRPSGGHAVSLVYAIREIYGVQPEECWWAASDLGWVVGHSFICYAPLLNGNTTVIYEGKSVNTPDAGAYFRVIAEHNVVASFTAPTAIRAIRKVDPNAELSKKYNLSKFRVLFLAGEKCDSESLEWAKKNFQAPVYDHWWQTETGSPITAPSVGCELSGGFPVVPKDVCGKPVAGWDIRVFRPDRTEAGPGELGRIVAKLPLPPGCFSTLYKNDLKFAELYHSTFPGYYDTMDAGLKTKDGYLCVLARDDDVINVAGHRLATSAIEESIMGHDAVAECAVVGVPDSIKGDVPLGLFVSKFGIKTDDDILRNEIISHVRATLGPVASFKLVARVQALPKTRSGKVARKTIADLARNKQIKIPVTIEDPTVYVDIRRALNTLDFALDAPDPE